VSPLENGAHLSAAEFLRRYETMPEVKKAELIDGVVYMGSPVRTDHHGEPDSLMQAWLALYAISTPGVKSATNATARLGPDDVPQPDGMLRILPECGGRACLDVRGYLVGGPELVVEVAASSVSLDAREKLASYRRAGVRECVIWRTEEEAVDWWVLEDDEYHPLPVGSVDSHSVQGRAGSRGSAPRALGWTGPIRGLTVRA
jgi:Uma2 family endonuclease